MGQLDRDGIVTPYQGARAQPWDPGAAIPAPLVLHRTTVPPAWVDYNGHMSESCYLLVFRNTTNYLKSIHGSEGTSFRLCCAFISFDLPISATCSLSQHI